MALCNEASRRRTLMEEAGAKVYEKPLSLDYIQDRIDTDDPMRGYMVRTADHGCLQGFISLTTFTTWQKWFQWDSSILDHDELEASGRQSDADGLLCRDLEEQERDGDPEREGVIWHRVGEISLLGGLKCGRWLVRAVIQEMEQSGDCDILVLQATDMSIPFYERMGFIRVGASAKYVPKGTDVDAAPTVEYRHWTFADQRTMPGPSYLMARRLQHARSKTRQGRLDQAELERHISSQPFKVPIIAKSGHKKIGRPRKEGSDGAAGGAGGDGKRKGRKGRKDKKGRRDRKEEKGRRKERKEQEGEGSEGKKRKKKKKKKKKKKQENGMIPGTNVPVLHRKPRGRPRLGMKWNYTEGHWDTLPIGQGGELERKQAKGAKDYSKNSTKRGRSASDAMSSSGGLSFAGGVVAFPSASSFAPLMEGGDGYDWEMGEGGPPEKKTKLVNVAFALGNARERGSRRMKTKMFQAEVPYGWYAGDNNATVSQKRQKALEAKLGRPTAPGMALFDSFDNGYERPRGRKTGKTGRVRKPRPAKPVGARCAQCADKTRHGAHTRVGNCRLAVKEEEKKEEKKEEQTEKTEQTVDEEGAAEKTKSTETTESTEQTEKTEKTATKEEVEEDDEEDQEGGEANGTNGADGMNGKAPASASEATMLDADIARMLQEEEQIL